ncbi:prolipoprotein diacylglyceryl transferase [Mucilaginibacter lappiensis]|uniref:Phosphatidylglycerol--prolipoprotein diacylglyceryl transferase n=1 Tax=Mucilaginibacter lappiensis TaxID=354630 RepID=A0A1N7EA01_9SPHI|nr:prolipoprotein diacylglyceryl transferase [Mucilaginibacter lappiensis]MBB6111597.1 prolipoprotein diacylglyceryl transferase [Mucilaginibacter lappiensis]MBB6131001.1 prolipoprotein diacylglyceryl transferase [Mucilaginibacter lappiensis]SIR84880.1 prolipoprotein diacylglyceryl transferase [Mucilaginibacter lappiensis]
MLLSTHLNIYGYITWNPNPNIFDLGFYALRWYSVLFLGGFVLSYLIIKQRFKSALINPYLLEKLTIYIIAGTLIGARLGHCLFYDWEYYHSHLIEIILPFQFTPNLKVTGYQGLASHGGGIGIFIALWLYHHKYQKYINLLWVMDQLALVVPLAGCCIRLGNLMNSEIIGRPTEKNWAFIFVRDDGIPRHPAQLYEALTYLSIFIILNLVTKYRSLKNGFLLGLFLALVFTARFLLEGLKEDQAAFEAHMSLNMGQLLSIPFIVAGIILMVIKGGKNTVMPGKIETI